MTMFRLSSLTLALSAGLAMTLLTGCNSDNDSSSATGSDYQYSTKAVYVARQDADSYEVAPVGFTPVFTELVARHGSRSLSSPKYDVLTKQIWDAASRQGALTDLGQKLGAKVDAVTAANRQLGYGLLSAVGKEEHALLATRLAERLPALLGKGGVPGCIRVETSGKDRANESAYYFMESLAKRVDFITDSKACYVSQQNPSEIDKGLRNKFELYFHKTEPEGDYLQYLPAFQAYMAFVGDEEEGVSPAPELSEALGGLKTQPQTRVMAREMLERLYSTAFVDELAAGVEYVAVNPEDGDKTYVRDEVDAALMLYNLFIIGPGMIREAQAQGAPWDLEQFITPEESAWFSYLSDAEDFYEKGPSLASQRATYAVAQPLLDGLFDEVQTQVVEGAGEHVAKLRFAHAETLIPLAALMQLEGSRQSAQPGVLMSQANNEWRGGWVSPYAANIQWDVYRNDAGRVLVKMLYNEKELAFKAGCSPIAVGSFFYDFGELKRCYGYPS
ncbi:MAG: histidine acid phosphatase [Aeromonas sp.]|uniref:histidine-type phosphatase n=1 Tax=Aeromonas media TaxID=651 RepID=UPI001B7166CF|nr:histidine acid phosphatase [Aeromonas sp.]MBP6166219.1 histidine acid phosphatase [Aeromonas sp.]MBP8078675.1 histidine acid phosphatase [Aeromonas sp.]MBP8188773.1 histidine acid phosphatase [Aeromonas sp.]MBP9677310.1 histidine acid phosphatase [Aeromonas sp.]